MIMMIYCFELKLIASIQRYIFASIHIKVSRGQYYFRSNKNGIQIHKKNLTIKNSIIVVVNFKFKINNLI